MKTERILEKIESFSCIEVLPAENVQIKKMTTLKDLQELKSRLPFLKKAIMTEGKILFENKTLVFGQTIKAV